MTDRGEGRPAFGLLGSGEFLEWSDEVDRWLLGRATGDGRVLILPTASAPEGDEVFDRWASMGMQHYELLGIRAEVLPVKSRADAQDDAFAARVAGASMAFFSGGNPAHLARTLAGTRLWAAVLDAMAGGLAYAGCSAGIACLGESALDSAARSFGADALRGPGLGLFPRTHLAPHWDAVDRYVPGLRALIEAAVPPDERLLAVDEVTALVGDGSSWEVLGAAGVHVREDGAWRSFAAGERFEVPLTSADTGISDAGDGAMAER
jgi:cyanophycinase